MSLPDLQQWWPGFAGFAWAWAWWLMPLPWLARRLLPARRGAGDALKMPCGYLLRQMATPRRLLAGTGPAALWLLWFLLCAALARPQVFGPAQAPPLSGRDLMLAVDLSGSMSETDMELGGQVVDRLTAAKAVLADFLDRREGDRVGLLVFGQRAYALTPLTRDRESVREQLRDSVVGLAGRETALGDAIGLAVKRLRAQPEGQRVLILLTDGVNTAGLLDPLKAAELAQGEGVRVHTIAFGSESGLMSIFGVPMPASAAGEGIDEATLRRIAVQTGGRFFRARDATELAGIYADLDRIEPIALPGEAVRPRLERYPWPLAAALLLAALLGLWPGRAR